MAATTTVDPVLNQPASNQAPNSHPGQDFQAPPPPQQQLPPRDTSKKRPLEYVSLKKTPYCKMRAILKDLRPHFLEVIRAPQLQDSSAAHEIQIRCEAHFDMKLMVELCRQMSVETIPMMEGDNVPGNQVLSAEKQDAQKYKEQQQDHKPAEHNPANRTLANLGYPDEENCFEKQQLDNSQVAGTYIVGGSAFGWNFITFSSNRPVYYGRTKELFRAGK